MNTDYKIITKTITNRIQPFVGKVISPEQTCNLKQRKIRHNLNGIRDAIIAANRNNEKACLIALDQMKAFDRVDHNFIFKCLEKMNFPTKIIKLIRTLYQNPTSRVKINGLLTEAIEILRGVRQGCPLSAILYIIVAEILTIAIKQNPKIKGLSTLNQPFLSQYAEDTATVITGDESIIALFQTLHDFELASGAKINENKTEALWLGSNKFREDKPLNLNWNSDTINVLGIPFSNLEQDNNEFWQTIFKKITNTITLWKKFHLSFKGKVIVVKQLILSQLVYPAFVLPIPYWLQEQTQKQIDKFIWDDKIPTINKNIMKLPIKEGRKNTPILRNFISALTLNTISDLYKTENSDPWKILFMHSLDLFSKNKLGIELLKMDIHPTTIQNSELPTFHKNLLKNWVEFIQPRPNPETLEHILSEPLFYNLNIIYNNSPLTFNSTFKKVLPNITTISDLCYNTVPGFLSRDQTNELHDTDVTEHIYKNLIQSLPNKWKNIIRTNSLDKPIKENILINKKEPKPVTNYATKQFYLEMNKMTWKETAKTLIGDDRW